MDIPPQLLALGIGSIPWLREQVGRWNASRAKAREDAAAADLIGAQTVREALADLRRRLDDCEKKHTEAATAMEHMQKQIDADTEALEAFARGIEERDKVIDGLRKEVADLRRTISTGRMGAA